ENVAIGKILTEAEIPEDAIKATLLRLERVKKHIAHAVQKNLIMDYSAMTLVNVFSDTSDFTAQNSYVAKWGREIFLANH
ncbi:MAG: hypothetical protein LBI39_03315, partial [Puniceicoccales bacterium]|nr:hypothetical protein [Puniceicoccales bacterium]